MSEHRVTHPRFLNLEQVLSRLGVSRSALYEWMAAGDFPAKVKMGARTAWVESEVEAWMLARIEASRSQHRRGEG